MADGAEIDNEPRGFKRVAGWLAVGSSIVTVVLTVLNAQTKMKVDATEANLKAIETSLHVRAQDVEDSKERVARYEWVRSRFVDLTETDPVKKTFTLALIRMALTKEEAERLFGGLSASSEKGLRDAGQKGLASTQEESAIRLVTQMTADTAEERKAAVALLIDQYRESPSAISATLRLFEDPTFSSLSPSAVINAFIFLGRTDPKTWRLDQVQSANQAIAKVESRGRHGTQTEQAIQSLRENLSQTRTSP